MNAVAPAVTLFGLSEEMVATGTGLTVNMMGIDVAAFGEGFETVMGNVPVAVSRAAGIVACICVGDWLVMVNFVEPKVIAAPVAKFCPATVIAIGLVLTIALVGLIKVIVGGMGLTVKGSGFDDRDSGEGSTTVTDAAPVMVKLAAGTVATSCVAEFKTVVRDTPLNCTTEDERKFCPVTVNAKLGLPSVALVEERLVSTGASWTAGVTEKVRVFEIRDWGEGSSTATCAVPAVARLAAGTLATSCVPEVNVVLRGAPFHSTTEPERKF